MHYNNKILIKLNRVAPDESLLSLISDNVNDNVDEREYSIELLKVTTEHMLWEVEPRYYYSVKHKKTGEIFQFVERYVEGGKLGRVINPYYSISPESSIGVGVPMIDTTNREVWWIRYVFLSSGVDYWEDVRKLTQVEQGAYFVVWLHGKKLKTKNKNVLI